MIRKSMWYCCIPITIYISFSIVFVSKCTVSSAFVPARNVFTTKKFNPSTHLFSTKNPQPHHYPSGDSLPLNPMDIVLFQQYPMTNNSIDQQTQFQQEEKEKEGFNPKEESNVQRPSLEIGAIQEDGSLVPLSTWSTESAFVSSTGDEFLEFLVDLDMMASRSHHLDKTTIQIYSILDSNVISYGSRQIGGGKGPGNPHGEESELLYYVHRKVIEEQNVMVRINPSLEIRW